MPRNRFIVPETVRINLSDGDWIQVKKELNVGEQKRLEGAGVKRSITGVSEVNWEAYNIERVNIWLTEWSFRNADDRPVKLELDAIRSLDVDTFQEIVLALGKHVLELDAEKKIQAAAKKENSASTVASPAPTSQS